VEDPKSILDPLPSYGAKSPPTNLSNSYNQHQSVALANKEASLPAKQTIANKVNHPAIDISQNRGMLSF